MEALDTRRTDGAAGPGIQSLESALSQAERQATETSAVVAKLHQAVKSTLKATKGGDLKSLHRNLDAALEHLRRVEESVLDLRRRWPYSDSEEEDYFARHYAAELLAASRSAGLSVSDLDGTMACYPSLLKVSAREKAVVVDKKTVREVRPSRLVARLLENQKRPSRLKLQPFVSALHSAYQLLAGKPRAGIHKLTELYDALTLLPGSKKDYTRQEFARDIYLLDASDMRETQEGVSFRIHPGATASKNRANLLVVVARDGVERTYFGIEFI